MRIASGRWDSVGNHGTATQSEEDSVREAICPFARPLGRAIKLACAVFIVWGFALLSNLMGADVPPGFTETTIAGPWADAVGVTFEGNGRMYVWERNGLIWIKDPADSSPSLLLDISQGVGPWEDHGML